jgi:hypothetical protein
MTTWSNKTNDLLVDLLYEISLVLGYDFDKAHIKRGVYVPQGHNQVDRQQAFIRDAIVDLFLGNISFPIEIKNYPVTPETQANQNLFSEEKNP